jgi:hypothetical protein
MDSRLYEALILLAVVALGGLSALIKTSLARLLREMRKNTTITTEARDASNGRLSEVIDRLAAERDRVQGLRYLVRERDDRLAYIIARMPEAEDLMRQYRNQRTVHATQADEIAAERHVLQE